MTDQISIPVAQAEAFLANLSERADLPPAVTVEKARRIVVSLGGQIATMREVREMLALQT